ncbi:MAG: hypothetical protein A2622_12510 [Bdellovibrionales bacterium RIFCSPHIGHO2_01_FULL_40_29]|nr:MAG: hypothetical protein A2622_12510 [Bdellovibrionales bacterium RIFCSPHIGHO2_01_FULL_40_29]OFZ33006.1 MAG: hypothetical protein A3D17_09820 [Bdellovibrionales bacterium RIFCSPHIGHO2_02_FULL_40_15]
MQTSYNIPPELKDTIPGYLSRRDQDIQALKTFAANEDFASMRSLGHKLKGNGSSFGFDQITEFGEQIMKACDAKNMLEINRLISSFEDEVVNIKSVVL